MAAVATATQMILMETKIRAQLLHIFIAPLKPQTPADMLTVWSHATYEW